MACKALQTNQAFLSTTLAHIDCQARTIGAYGYGALADPGSVVSIALTGLLTIFVALFGVRLLIGNPVAGGDVIGNVLRVGIVLTIASSWPAWRTVGYDLVLNGPAEVADAIGMASGLPGSRGDMLARLQNADDGIVAMTEFGSGRLTGEVAIGTDISDSGRGIALSDQFALGAGRTLFLSSAIGSVAFVRLGAGILLAIAPLMAGLLFFAGTATVFFGWLRALAFCALGNLVLLVVQGTQLALLYPWLGDVLQQRAARMFTPSAPTELLVLTLGFAVLTAGLLFLTAKLIFLPSVIRLSIKQEGDMIGRPRENRSSRGTDIAHPDGAQHPSRALTVSQAVAQVMRREEGLASSPRMIGSIPMAQPTAEQTSSPAPGHVIGPTDALGTGFKRSHRRASASAERRDGLR